MRSAEQRVRDLVRAGAIDEDQGAALVEAIKPSAEATPPWWTAPFARWSGEVTAAVGALAAAIELGSAWLGVRFAGTLDIHAASKGATLHEAALDQLVAWPLSAFVMWAVVWPSRRTTRFVDVLGVVGAARLPGALAAPILALLHPFGGEGHRLGPTAVLGLTLALGSLGMQLYLLLSGLLTVSGARKARDAALVVTAVVIAEIVSKVALELPR
jgi:hypothetical protein